MQRVLAFVITFFLLSCVSGGNISKNDGDLVMKNDKIVVPDEFDFDLNSKFDFDYSFRNKKMLLVDSATFLNSYKVIYHGIHFTVGVDSQSVIKFIQTVDVDFVSPEGVNMNMTLKEVMGIAKGKLVKESGWAYYLVLPSKWCVAFISGSSLTEVEPILSSRINYIFKR
jgi:hypothetical protein